MSFKTSNKWILAYALAIPTLTFLFAYSFFTNGREIYLIENYHFYISFKVALVISIIAMIPHFYFLLAYRSTKIGDIILPTIVYVTTVYLIIYSIVNTTGSTMKGTGLLFYILFTPLLLHYYIAIRYDIYKIGNYMIRIIFPITAFILLSVGPILIIKNLRISLIDNFLSKGVVAQCFLSGILLLFSFILASMIYYKIKYIQTYREQYRYQMMNTREY